MNPLRRVFLRTYAFRECFNPTTRSGAIVLDHLRKFCCANRTTQAFSRVTATMDPMAMAVSEGRREVWLEIMRITRLTEEQLAAVAVHESSTDDSGDNI